MLLKHRQTFLAGMFHPPAYMILLIVLILVHQKAHRVKNLKQYRAKHLCPLIFLFVFTLRAV